MVYFHFQNKLVQIKLLVLHIQRFVQFSLLFRLIGLKSDERRKKNLNIYDEILTIGKPPLFIFLYFTSQFLNQENKPFFSTLISGSTIQQHKDLIKPFGIFYSPSLQIVLGHDCSFLAHCLQNYSNFISTVATFPAVAAITKGKGFS